MLPQERLGIRFNDKRKRKSISLQESRKSITVYHKKAETVIGGEALRAGDTMQGVSKKAEKNANNCK